MPDNDEPINFDINDYKKPFNFKELFKELNLPLDDEDEDQKQETEEDEGSYSAKLVRDEDDKEEKDETDGNYSSKYADSSQESSSTEAYASSESLEDNENVNSTEVQDDDHASEDSKTVKISEDEFKYGDRDFFKPLFGDKPKRSSQEYYYDGDKNKYYKQEASSRKDVLAKRYGSHSYPIDEEKLPPLTNILAKKDSISRFSGNENQNAKKNYKIPREYENEWVLKYEFPKKKQED